MIARCLAAAILRRVPHGLWVNVRYCEPYGARRWGVHVERLGGRPAGECLAAGRYLLPTLWRAWRAACAERVWQDT
jgi:hypothetical protein